MAFQLARRTRTVVLMLLVWPKSGSRKVSPGCGHELCGGEQLERHERGIRAVGGRAERIPPRHGSMPGAQQHQGSEPETAPLARVSWAGIGVRMGRGSTRPRALPPPLDNSGGQVRLQLPGLK
jgi:hypothetical protein